MGPACRDRRGFPAGAEERRASPAGGARAGEPRAATGQRDPQGSVGFLRDRARRSNQEVVAFIDANRHRWGVEPICRVLQFAPSSYYEAKSRAVSTRAARDAVLVPEIRRVFAENYSVYGA